VSDSLSIVRTVYDAFAKGDVSAVLGLMSENIEWNEAEHFTYWPGGPLIGPQAVLAGVFARIGQDFEGFRIEVLRLAGCGETVLAEARYHATAKATGRPFDVQVAHVWDVRDGKVVRFQQYVDTWQAAEVTGITPLRNAVALQP
jgi:ketosteroid isomerase-like protein